MPALNFTDNKAVEELVGRRHPEFTDREPHWTFCESCYVGGRQWINAGNVFKFFKEGDQEYKDRLKRTYRANHTKRVVETINRYLFKQRPTRSAATPALVQRFWRNVDKAGKSIDEFTSYLDQMASVFGRVYVVVDRPAQVASSRQDEKLPYAYVVKPTHMLDLGYDEDGALTWALIAEDYRDDATPLGSGKPLVRFRLWTRDEWYLFGPESAADPDKIVWLGPDKGYGFHGLGEVPIVIHSDPGDATPYAHPALIDDIAYMDRALVNYGALLDEILYEQTFSQLVMPSEALLPGTREMGQMIAAAKERIFLYNGNSPRGPEFINPDASQANLIRDTMSDLARWIYAVTGTDNDANSQSMSTGKSYASGTVRAFDHASIENMLLGKAQNLEKTEDRLLRLVHLWMGASDPDIDRDWVRYPTSFDIRGLQAELAIGLDLFEMAVPPVVMREHVKTMTEKLFPRKSPDELAEIHAAIDTWTPQYKTDAALAKRKVANDEDKVAVSREQLAQQAEIEDKRLAAQKETAKAQAKAAAAAPKPAPAARAK